MACKTCGRGVNSSGSNVSQSRQPVSSVDFTVLKTNRSRVRSGNKNYSLMTALVKIQPPGGFKIDVSINGHDHVANGNNAVDVVNNVIEMYKTNGVEVTTRNAWFNANIYWLKKLSIRHGYTTVDELMAMVEKPEANLFEQPKPPEQEDPSPIDWGGNAWGFLGAYISQDKFDMKQFNSILGIFKSMLADEFIGCEECSEHFEVTLAKAKISVKKQIQAARWMFDTMNEINKSNDRHQLSWTQAVKKHRWENL